MNQKTTSEMIDIMQAHQNGMPIESAWRIEGIYEGDIVPSWDWIRKDYRIKKQETKSRILTPLELFERGAIYVRRKLNNCYGDIFIINNFTDKHITIDNEIIDDEYACFYEWTADRKTWHSFYI